MKRVTTEQLELLSRENHAPIEFDYEQGIAVVTVRRGRRVTEYCASLPAEEPTS